MYYLSTPDKKPKIGSRQNILQLFTKYIPCNLISTYPQINWLKIRFQNITNLVWLNVENRR